MELYCPNLVSMSGFIFIQPTNIWSTCWTKSGPPAWWWRASIGSVSLWHHFSTGELLVLGRVDLRYWWIVNKITTFGSTNPQSTHGPPTTMTTGLRALRTIRNSKVPERDGGCFWALKFNSLQTWVFATRLSATKLALVWRIIIRWVLWDFRIRLYAKETENDNNRNSTLANFWFHVFDRYNRIRHLWGTNLYPSELLSTLGLTGWGHQSCWYSLPADVHQPGLCYGKWWWGFALSCTLTASTLMRHGVGTKPYSHKQGGEVLPCKQQKTACAAEIRDLWREHLLYFNVCLVEKGI